MLTRYVAGEISISAILLNDGSLQKKEPTFRKAGPIFTFKA